MERTEIVLISVRLTAHYTKRNSKTSRQSNQVLCRPPQNGVGYSHRTNTVLNNGDERLIKRLIGKMKEIYDETENLKIEEKLTNRVVLSSERDH